MRLTPGRRPLPALVAALTLTALLGALLPATSATATPTAAPAATPAATPPATPTPIGPDVPGLPPVAEEKAAEQALQAVQEALADSGPVAEDPVVSEDDGRELTLLMRDLYLAQDSLDGADARIAARLLDRPGSDADDCGPGEPGAGSDFCVHWVTSGRNAPSLTDDNSNGIPDQVDNTRAAIAKAWQVIVLDGGYRAPLRDQGGPDGRLDVYLNDQGASSLYGSCTATEPASAPATSADEGGAAESPVTTATFCELDNDYRPGQYPAQTPLKNLQVTAAHEFFHAVQYAYDATEDGWLLEGTAAWVEDEVYDDINDNLQYLAYSPLSTPSLPLDRTQDGLSIYGSWIWWRYLAERFSDEAGTGMPVVIRDIIEQTGRTSGHSEGVWSLPAIKRELTARGAAFPSTLASFATQNRAPRGRYEEGATYSQAPLRGGWALRKARRDSGLKTVTLPHLSSATYTFRRGKDLTGRWRVRVKVDMPDAATLPVAVVTTVRAGGVRRDFPVSLGARGNGKRVLGFGKKVRAVELTLVNAGHRYRCARGTQYACNGGRPQSDGARSAFRAVALR